MFLAVVAFLAGPIGFFIAISAMSRSTRLRADLDEAQRRLESLSGRVHRLDRQVGQQATRPPAAEPAAAAAQAIPVERHAPTPPVRPAPLPQPAPPAARPPEPVVPPPPSPIPPLEERAPFEPTLTMRSHRAQPAPRPADPAAPRAGTPAPPATGRIEGWEATIGGSWLNRIGVALLVIGIAFALGYTLTNLGPAGKAALATAVSLLLIVAGIILERRESYQFYGRGLLGGGWAALYATAYAVHELEATRVVRDPRLGFALLLLVGVGMIAHSLRYRNQGLTALAYSLAYAAIVLHSISPYTLAAATLLGLGTVLHLLRRRWYGVALGGVVVTYGCLLLWYLRQGVMTPETMRLGLGALAIDWLVFLVADFGNEPEDDTERRSARAVGLLNALAAGCLGYMAWHDVFPGTGWRPLAGLGAAYVVTSTALRLSGRLSLHPVHSLVASLLLAIAARMGLDRSQATWAWLAEAQVLVLIGVALKDRFHRLLGCTLFLAPMCAIVYDQVEARLRRPDGIFDGGLFLQTMVACLCFYFTFARLKAFATPDGEGRVEEALRRTFSYGAFVLIVLSLWVQLPTVYVAPAGAVLMLLLFEIGGAREVVDLRIQSYLAGVVALFSALALSAPSKALLGSLHARVPALIGVALVYLVIFMRQARGRSVFPDLDDGLRPYLSWGGAGLTVLLVWLEVRPVAVGPLWLILALLLVEAGILLGEAHLRRPGYLTLLAAHVSLVMSNLTATDQVSGWSVRAATLVPAIAATYYLWWRLREMPRAGVRNPGDAADEAFGRLLSYLAAALAGLFVRFEFGLQGAALRWSLAMIALLLAGHWLRDADLRFQSYILSAAVLVRAIGFDFRLAGPVLGVDGPLAIAATGTACYLAAGFLMRRWTADSGARPDRRSLQIESALAANGHDLMWLFSVVLMALYLYRTWSGSALIVAWAMEGLCATVAGFAARARSLRLSGLGLLALALAMTLVKAFTTFDTLGRIVSFLVLGVVLLLISLGYTRYRESFRKTP
jgi:uncharacterized membrane protein